jgi:pyruvate dehydrogenase E1 component
MEVERYNTLHPTAKQRTPYVTECLSGGGAVVAASDYIRTYPDLIRAWVPGTYRVLGTDGFGRSDSRAALRGFFEVDRRYVAVAALKALADDGAVKAGRVKEAIERYEIDPEAPMPTTV